MQGVIEEIKKNPDENSYSKIEKSRDLKKDEALALATDIHGDEGEEEEEEEDEEEFSFVCGVDTSPIAAEDAFINGQIKPVFPLFNMEYSISEKDLPFKPPVKNVFVETPENEKEEGDEIVGPYCEWSGKKAVEVETTSSSSEICKKSNSTGFSKIWRFKEFMGRSNSDGKDAFVFLNGQSTPPPAAAAAEVAGKVKKVGKSKTASLSAHEVYLKSKAKEEERRRSYLPYRPEIVGFFTNVNGGLSKNVHPF